MPPTGPPTCSTTPGRPSGARSGAANAVDTYRRNLQRAYLDQAHYLLHDAESNHWSPPSSGNLRVSSNNDPPLNADLHIGQSDIRPLIRDQLRLLDRRDRGGAGAAGKHGPHDAHPPGGRQGEDRAGAGAVRYDLA
jgi:hypothetical protein